MKTVDTSKFSTAVRVSRKGMTLDEFSKATGISKATISRVEHGKMPDTETYLTLINVIGIPSEFFETDK